MSKLRSDIIESMISHAQGHIDKHKMNVEVYLTTPAGIGDHSTSDLHNNLNEGLAKLADAQDRLETLSKFFPEQGNDNFSTQ